MSPSGIHPSYISQIALIHYTQSCQQPTLEVPCVFSQIVFEYNVKGTKVVMGNPRGKTVTKPGYLTYPHQSLWEVPAPYLYHVCSVWLGQLLFKVRVGILSPVSRPETSRFPRSYTPRRNTPPGPIHRHPSQNLPLNRDYKLYQQSELYLQSQARRGS